jgi:hypothetical protein
MLTCRGSSPVWILERLSDAKVPRNRPGDLRIVNASRSSLTMSLWPDCSQFARRHGAATPPQAPISVDIQRLRHRSKPSHTATYLDSADLNHTRLPDLDTTASRPVPRLITRNLHASTLSVTAQLCAYGARRLLITCHHPRYNRYNNREHGRAPRYHTWGVHPSPSPPYPSTQVRFASSQPSG